MFQGPIGGTESEENAQPSADSPVIRRSPGMGRSRDRSTHYAVSGDRDEVGGPILNVGAVCRRCCSVLWSFPFTPGQGMLFIIARDDRVWEPGDGPPPGMGACCLRGMDWCNTCCVVLGLGRGTTAAAYG